MKKVLIIYLCVFVFAFSQFSNKIITFDYSKSSNGSYEESVEVFYQPFIASYMFVHDPLIQHIRMQPDRLLYYYPDRNIAIIMNNPDALIATNPVQLFVKTGSEDLGLSDLGFKLIDYQTNHDTLISTWEIKGKNKDEYIRIDVFSDVNNIFKTLSYDAKDKLIKSVRYGKWTELSNYPFPLQITIFEDGKVEEYNFSRVALLSDLPDSIPGLFDLPENCEIHEYKF